MRSFSFKTFKTDFMKNQVVLDLAIRERKMYEKIRESLKFKQPTYSFIKEKAKKN